MAFCLAKRQQQLEREREKNTDKERQAETSEVTVTQQDMQQADRRLMRQIRGECGLAVLQNEKLKCHCSEP